MSISAQGTASSTANSLAIFAQPQGASGNTGWTGVATDTGGSTNVSGNFTPTKGCGTTYKVLALEEVSGTLSGTNAGQYDYLTYDAQSYIANLQQETIATASLASNPYFEWWPFTSQVSWNLKFTTTVCSPQTIALNAVVKPRNGFAVTQQSGSGIFTFAGNGQAAETFSASISGCSFGWTTHREFRSHTIE